MYAPQPTPKMIAALAGADIRRIACGQSHALASDAEGGLYTWGNGGYGRLGHRVQKDELAPRRVEDLRPPRMGVIPGSPLAAGGTATFCVVSAGNQLYGWGRLKVSGDNTTHPYPVYELQGWNVRSVACGPYTYAVAADKSVITWGQATNGELGYGEGGKKSSANPDKCLALEGVHTQQVAGGNGFNLFLCEPTHPKVTSAPLFATTAPAVEAGPAGGDDGAGTSGAAGGKRKAPAAAGGGKGKKAK